MMACSHQPPPQIIIRVEIDRLPSTKKTGSDTPDPFSSSLPHPEDEGGTTKIHRWEENRSLSCRSQNRAEGRRRPASSKSLGRLDSRPQSSRGGGSRGERRPPSSRPDSHVDRRPHSSSRPGSRVDNNILHDFASCLDSRPPSCRTGGRSKRRPRSPRSGGSRSPTLRTRNGQLNNTISADSNGLVLNEFRSSKPRSSGQDRSSSGSSFRPHSQFSRRPPSSSRPENRSGDCTNSPRLQGHVSPRSPSPGGRESTSPEPHGGAEDRRRRYRQQGQSQLRPRSSQISGGRAGSSLENSRGQGGVSRSRKKNRPWTAPVSGRGRVTDNIPDEYNRTGGGTWMGPEDSDETKRKQEEIIRRILEEFDLEETMTKYRNSNVMVYRRDGKSLADFRFRSEMIRMMGSEEIRLNDQDWSRRFQRRLVEDYERLLDEQEQHLARAEKQRLHRLRVEGVLHEDEEHPPAHGSENGAWLHKTHSKKKSRGHGRGRPMADGGDGSDSEHKPIFADEESDRRERTLLAQRQEKVYHPPEDVQTQVARLNREDVEERKEKGEDKGKEKAVDRQDRGKEHKVEWRSTSRQSMTEEEDEEEKMAKRRRKKYQHLPCSVAQLYEEETVSGLYQMAAELLNPGSAAEGKTKSMRFAQH